MLEGAIYDARAVIDVAPGLPCVMGDAGRLALLFQNLVSNGIKFNQSERPVVEIGVADETDGFVRLFVRDNGIGIAKDYQTQIFEIFERLHSRTEYPGTGAGLAIVRRIVELYGGTLQVDSTPGQGATFHLTLPLAERPT